MYQIRNADGRAVVAESTSRDEVLHQLDTECRRLHDQAAAIPSAPPATYRFDVLDPQGREIAWLTYSPDTARPYESVVLDETLTGERS